ncbi:adhesion G protein-coupled receptor L4-like [Aethina tumida]|uniref:adhesion G protein-coupled receptor L4-like n=1 Tax=Aethina tumida TaxID=116153 RepID=UPI0021496777|nr:adhesion G protein-coupled receptor L4-like [Aethina tumida]
MCMGNLSEGAYWGTVSGHPTICSKNTTDIFNLWKLDNSTQAIETLTNISSNFLEKVTPMQTHYTSLIISDYVNSLEIDDEKKNIQNMFEIVDNLIGSNRKILEESQITLNSTDIVLNSLDIATFYLNKNTAIDMNYFFVRRSQINESSIGWLLTSDRILKPLSHPFVFDDHINDNPLAIGYFSNFSELLSKNNSESIFIFFSNPNLFNERNKSDPQSWIVSVVAPGFKESLESPLMIILKQNKYGRFLQSCAFWFYGQYEQVNINGSWSVDNEIALNYETDYLICNYTHMTHFGMLISDNDYDDLVLSIITYIGTILSLVGILAVMGTIFLFKNFKDRKNIIILSNYIVSLILVPLALIISNLGRKGTICVLTGMFLHYTVLAQLCWMTLLSYFQYRRYIIVFVHDYTNIILKSSLIGWVLPIIGIIVTATISVDNYHKTESHLCYLSGLTLKLAVTIPTILITFINVTIFFMIIYKLHKSNQKHQTKSFLSAILKLSNYLFFLFGLTWIFGIAYAFTDILFLNYCFTALTAVQGFMICLHVLITTKQKIQKIPTTEESLQSTKLDKFSGSYLQISES